MRTEVQGFITRQHLGGTLLEVGSYNVNGAISTEAGTHIRLDLRKGPNVEIVADASERIPFPDEHFDVVLCAETLEHMERWKEALTEMWRVLREGGKMVITTPIVGKKRHMYPNDYWRFSMEDYEKIFPELIVKEQIWKKGIGVVAIKTGPLNLDVSPYEVPL